jgi:DNA-directed RNA polymerase specialized sigma24 family protein
MASTAIQAIQSQPVTPTPAPNATTPAPTPPPAPAATQKNQAPQPATQPTLPQDTVTISPQAQAIANTANAALTSSTTLSSQEQAQLQVLLTQGWSLNQIASSLNVSVTTVEQYLTTAQISALPL